jgi:nitrogen regulatory protein PII
MKDIALLVTVTKRSDTEKFVEFFKKYGASVIYSAVGRGTARQKTLDLLGLEESEKTVHFTVVDGEIAKKLIRRLSVEMHLDLPDQGVAAEIPVSSIGGARTMNYYLDGKEAAEKEEESLDCKYELIIAVAETGYSEMVMEAAKSAGAGGGTVIHAKGTGAQKAERFFGVSLADEKELIFIVAASKKKKDIMKAIMHGAGVDTEAKGLVFSLPITETAGLKLLEQEEGLSQSFS